MSSKVIQKDSITGVILAGGEARRMGGQDKGLIQLGGQPLIEHVLATLKPQVGKIIINANRNHDSYGKYALPIVADELEGFNGPLAGMASCMRHIDTEYMVTVPCDSPYVPRDLVSRLSQQLQSDDAEISVAHNGERMQPVFSLMKCDLLDSLLVYLNQGHRKIDRWYEQHKLAITDFSDAPETFININTPDDIKNIEAG